MLPPKRTGHLYVTSRPNNRLYVFTDDEQHVTDFAHIQLTGLTVTAVNNAGPLYVAGFGNDQVLVFDLDSAFQQEFSAGGTDGPDCVASDSEDSIYSNPVR